VPCRAYVLEKKYFKESISTRLHFEKLPINSGGVRIIQFKNLPGPTLAVDYPVALGQGNINQLFQGSVLRVVKPFAQFCWRQVGFKVCTTYG